MDSSRPHTPPPASTEPETPTDPAAAPADLPEDGSDGLAEALAELPDQIERLADLDPADAAAPGAAIADLLSRALEEEER